MKTKLSICIPNYNRAKFLYRNLKEIGNQADESIEVVISDDCSVEDIDQVVDRIKTHFPRLNITYKKQNKNLGFDLNVLAVVSMAKGEYCWLLSNDDVLMPNALSKIVRILNSKRNISLLLVNYQRFDKLLNKVTAEQMINIRKDLFFKDKNDFWFYKTKNSYFKCLGVNTLTMSCNVFSRSLWNKFSTSVDNFIGHNFIHVFVLASIAKEGTKGFISAPQVSYLSNNHRTWPNDIWKDYNNVFLTYMKDLGYKSKNIDILLKTQREYEAREAVTKNAILMAVYRFVMFVFRFLTGLLK